MSIPVVTVDQMRRWEEATWALGRTPQEVITRVGERLAARILRLTRARDRILILAGRGHNGDDARATLPHLGTRQVLALDIGSPASDLARVQDALQSRPAWVVDGLFGIGLNRPLSAAWMDLFGLVNRSGLPVLAVDVPSGLDADSGQPRGAAIAAATTVTLGAPKTGLLQPPAWDWVGRLDVEPDIGLAPCPVDSDVQWVLPADWASFPPRRPVQGHKGVFGHLVLVAGSHGFHGAAVLAARGAQRARPGLVTLVVPAEIYVPVAAQLQAVMVRAWEPGSALPTTASAMVIGPGLASPGLPREIRADCLEQWARCPFPMIADASALDWLADADPPPKGAIRVVTPHPGEAARLLRTDTTEVQRHRIDSLRALSARLGNAWVVLKGSHTLVGRAEGPVSVNSSGNPGLAQGGSGDVLAGYIGGWMAQPALRAAPGAVLRYAVWQHGHSADLLEERRRNWTVEDLAENLGTDPAG